jgi:hypothetical protein
MRALVLVTLGLVGCATTKASTYIPTVPDNPEKRVEKRALPPDAATEPLPPGTSKDDFVQAQEAGECLDGAGNPLPGAPKPCPIKPGILSGEGRSARDMVYRIRYTELRKLYDSDRAVWNAHRELYETRLEQAETALKDAKPNWFQEHAFQLGVIGGFVLGSAATVAITFAVNQASK